MGKGRRIRWAERENARLAAEYQKALAVWKQNEQLIEWYNEQVRSAQPLGRTDGLKLRRNEQVFWTAADVSMIEVPGHHEPVHPGARGVLADPGSRWIPAVGLCPNLRAGLRFRRCHRLEGVVRRRAVQS